MKNKFEIPFKMNSIKLRKRINRYFILYGIFMENIVPYICFVVFLALLARSGKMGAEKMIKFIIGNIISGLACYFFGESLHLFIQTLLSEPAKEFMGITYENYAHFFENAQFLLVIILFLLLCILIYTSSKIQVSILNDSPIGRWIFILLIPFCAISFFFAFFLSLQGEGITIRPWIKERIASYSPTAKYIMQNLPFWNFLYLICIIALTHPLKVSVLFKRRNTIIPEGLE